MCADRPARSAGHGGTWPLLLLVGLGTVVGFAVWAVLVNGGHSVRPWLVVAIGAAGGFIGAAVRLVAVQLTPPVRVPVDVRRRVLTDRERGGVVRLARAIDAGIESPDRFDIRVRPQLIRLAEHLLRRNYGVDLRSQPRRARELLGDSLWQMILTAPASPPTRRQMAQWVSRIESLRAPP